MTNIGIEIKAIERDRQSGRRVANEVIEKLQTTAEHITRASGQLGICGTDDPSTNKYCNIEKRAERRRKHHIDD